MRVIYNMNYWKSVPKHSSLWPQSFVISPIKTSDSVAYMLYSYEYSYFKNLLDTVESHVMNPNVLQENQVK